MGGFFCCFLLLLLLLLFKNNLVSSMILPQFSSPPHPWSALSCVHSSPRDHLYPSVSEFVFKVDKNKSFSRTSGYFFLFACSLGTLSSCSHWCFSAVCGLFHEACFSSLLKELSDFIIYIGSGTKSCDLCFCLL